MSKLRNNILITKHELAALAFGEILNNQTLNSQQIRFLDTIINYLTVQGIIDPTMLFEAPFPTSAPAASWVYSMKPSPAKSSA